jgi:predicted metal-dependent phosphoesterase TrpH
MSEIADYSKMVDFHTHSSASDGTLTPEELAELAGKMQVAAIALTDHDTVAGVREFMAKGREYPATEFIPGVELSSLYGSREMHIAGLYIDIENAELLAYLEQMRKWRLERNIEMARRLASLGCPVDRDELDFLHNDSIGRVHFAAYLVKHYGFESIQEVFNRYLKKNCSAYVQRVLPMPSEAIDIIHRAGGIAIWAHPVSRDHKSTANFIRRMVKKMRGYGLDGIECYYSMFGAAETAILLETAVQYEMVVSGGSDFHGENRPGIGICSGGGKMNIPSRILDDMKKYMMQRGDLKNA